MNYSFEFSRAQKAAAILVAMGKPAAGRLLKFFKQEELRALIDSARTLRTIPQGDLERIVNEFEMQFAEGGGLLDSGDTMDTILNESLTPEEVSAIMDREAPKAEVKDEAPSIWPAVEKVGPDRLGEFLAAEHPQAAALLLSKLSTASAASALLTLDKAARAEVVKRMLTIAEISPGAQKILESQIRSRMLANGAVKDTASGRMRVAGILNELEKPQLDELVADMREAGTADMEAILARLFSFEDIVKLTQKSRVALFDGLPTETVTLALRGCEPELKEAALSALGARSRRMIESELAMEANIAAADITKARRTIASAALRLAEQGVVELPSSEEVAAAA